MIENFICTNFISEASLIFLEVNVWLVFCCSKMLNYEQVHHYIKLFWLCLKENNSNPFFDLFSIVLNSICMSLHFLQHCESQRTQTKLKLQSNRANIVYPFKTFPKGRLKTLSKKPCNFLGNS